MNPAANLWSQLLADVDDPNLMWQLLALAVSIALGWLLSRGIMKRFSGSSGALNVSLDSFQRVLTPLLTLGFIVLASRVLSHWQAIDY